MKEEIIKKRQREKDIISLMMRIYCCGNKHIDIKNRFVSKADAELCDDCSQLLKYAIDRTYKCPFIETKTFCSNCKLHCYQKHESEKIKKVMRYAGPRLLLYHPIPVIKHWIESKKEKKKAKEGSVG